MKTSGVSNYYEDISKGIVEGHSMVYKFGRGKTVLGKKVPIWDGAGNYVFPTTADFVTFKSSSTADKEGGVGAITMQVYGLDENGESIDEVIELKGTSNTVSVNRYIRMFRMKILTASTTLFPYDSSNIGNNVGTITATHNGTGNPIAFILPEMGQTLMAIYTVPKGYTAYIYSAHTSEDKGKEITGYMFTRDMSNADNAWNCKGIRDMYRNSVGKDFVIPPHYTELTDLVMAIKGITTGDNVTGTFELVLVKN